MAKRLRDIIERQDALEERIRTPEEAHKLWNYIGKRADRKRGLFGRLTQFGGLEIPIKKRVKFPMDVQNGNNSDMEISHEDIPINKINYTQPEVSHRGVKHYLDKLTSGRSKSRIEAVKRRDGTYDIKDGHHRLVSRKLRGHVTTPAVVWKYKGE